MLLSWHTTQGLGLGLDHSQVQAVRSALAQNQSSSVCPRLDKAWAAVPVTTVLIWRRGSWERHQDPPPLELCSSAARRTKVLVPSLQESPKILSDLLLPCLG